VEQIDDLLEELFRPIAALGKEGVREHALRDGEAAKLAGDDHDGDDREAPPHDGKKLKSIHVGHLQVRDDDVRQGLLESGQPLESIFGCLDLVALGFEYGNTDSA